jgi:hypothetical protein
MMKVEPALDDLNIKKKGLNVNKRPLHVANLKSGRGNLFALAYGTAAWSAQASPFFETKTSFKIRFTAESRRSLRRIFLLRVTEAFLFGGLPSALLALSLSKGSPPNKKSVSPRPLRLCVENPILDKRNLSLG